MEAGVGLRDGVPLHVRLKHCTCPVRTQRETLWMKRRMAKCWLYLEKRWHGEGLLAGGAEKNGVSRNRRWHSDIKCVSMEGGCRGAAPLLPLATPTALDPSSMDVPLARTWPHAAGEPRPAHWKILAHRTGCCQRIREPVRLEKHFGDHEFNLCPNTTMSNRPWH